MIRFQVIPRDYLKGLLCVIQTSFACFIYNARSDSFMLSEWFSNRSTMTHKHTFRAAQNHVFCRSQPPKQVTHMWKQTKRTSDSFFLLLLSMQRRHIRRSPSKCYVTKCAFSVYIRWGNKYGMAQQRRKNTRYTNDVHKRKKNWLSVVLNRYAFEYWLSFELWIDRHSSEHRVRMWKKRCRAAAAVAVVWSELLLCILLLLYTFFVW